MGAGAGTGIGMGTGMGTGTGVDFGNGELTEGCPLRGVAAGAGASARRTTAVFQYAWWCMTVVPVSDGATSAAAAAAAAAELGRCGSVRTGSVPALALRCVHCTSRSGAGEVQGEGDGGGTGTGTGTESSWSNGSREGVHLYRHVHAGVLAQQNRASAGALCRRSGRRCCPVGSPHPDAWIPVHTWLTDKQVYLEIDIQ